MKQYILFFSLLMGAVATNAQDKKFGLGVGLGFNNALALDMSYYKGKNGFSIGYTRELHYPEGKAADSQLSNYGRTVKGTGTFYGTVDLGYHRVLNPKLSIAAELSLGSRSYYTDYSDERFSAGGYYLVNNTKSLAGVGASASYQVSDLFYLSGGYNSLRSVTMGLGFMLPF